jgi:hypothetical protein
MHTRVLVAVVALAALLASGLAAAAKTRQGSQPIYSAITVLPKGKRITKRCSGYLLTVGTYTGTSTSPDPRLGGPTTLSVRLAVFPGSDTGFATGTLTIRDGRGRTRVRSTLTGVITNRTVVNGLIRGALSIPSATLLANVTILFDSEYRNGVVRLGLESGANSAVAYTPLRSC